MTKYLTQLAAMSDADLGHLRQIQFPGTQSGADVALCRGVLFELGYPVVVASKVNKVLIDHVERFQAAHKLSVDGIWGKQCWAKARELSRAATKPSVPVIGRHSKLDRLLVLLRDPVFRKQARARGRALTGGGNACGTTCSQYWIALGLIAQPYTLAQTLANTLYKTGLFDKVKAADLDKGDVAVCKDLTDTTTGGGPNGLADHIFLVGGEARPGYVWAIDNRKDDPYERNVGAGPRTPVDYGLRLKA